MLNLSFRSRKFCPDFKRVIAHSGSFCRKNLSTKYRRREPGKGKALRFPAVFLLNTLLSFSLTPEEKEHILEEEYGISMKMSEEDFIARMREERENGKTI